MIARSMTVLACIALVGGCATTNSAPTLDANQVALYRDTWSVPHVYARSEEDGFHLCSRSCQ